MNGFGLHVIPMVGLILLSWLGLRSLGMERGAPPAAPGWPSGCTFPEVELPGGQSSQAVLRQLDFELREYNANSVTRALPECCFLEAGLTSLISPSDFTWTGPAACERCLQLLQVDLSHTEITEIMNCAFAHCHHLQHLKLPNKLRRIQQEAFLKCAALTEVSVPPTLLKIERRAFAGCTQLNRFQRTGKRTTWRGTYSRANAFLRCDNLDMPKWVRWIPRNPKEEDQWADDSFRVLH